MSLARTGNKRQVVWSVRNVLDNHWREARVDIASGGARLLVQLSGSDHRAGLDHVFIKPGACDYTGKYTQPVTSFRAILT